MKKFVLVLSLFIFLGVFTACEDPGSTVDLDILTPANPGRISFMYQTVHTQQYVGGIWTSNIEYPAITIISSRAELEKYCDDYEGLYDFSRHEYSNNGFMDAIERYSDAFFSESFLVIVLLEETSGSTRHRVESVEDDGDIVITRLLPEIITADMAQWHIIIELDKEYQLEQYKAVFLEERL